MFIDETWAKTNMAPLRGWAPRGERLHAKVPYGHWRTMTFLAALRHDRIDAPCVLDQPVNGQSFTAYVEQCLVPTLAPGDVVIMDNLSSHKRPAVRKAIRSVGARLLFLPPYTLRLLSNGCAAGTLAGSAPTSTRSNRSSPSSNTSCAKPPNGPTKQHGSASDRSSTTSRLTNAPPTSPTQAMPQANVITP